MRSSSSAVSSGASAPRLRTIFSVRMASGGRSASSPLRASTASSSLSFATACVMSPHASARSAEIRWPVIMKSLARVMPMSRIARWVPPLPGIIPSRTSGKANSEWSVAMRRSHATANSRPAPME